MPDASLYPALSYYAITPDDTVNLPNMGRTLYVGTGGDVALVNSSDQIVIHTNVPSGSKLVCFYKRVNATGTSASDFIAYF